MAGERSSARRSRPADPAAAEHPLAVVQHRGLARRYRARRSFENEFGFAAPRDRVAASPATGGCAERSFAATDPMPAAAAAPSQFISPSSKAGLGQSAPRADDDAARLGIDPQHVERLGGGDAQAPCAGRP